MMVQRLFSFLVVWLLIFNGEIFGQESIPIGQQKGPGRGKIIQEGIKRINKEQHTFPRKLNKNYTLTMMGYSPVTVPSCFGYTTYLIRRPITYVYIKDLGWFCKKELQLDKITPVSFRFRLGSLEYVNWMEQKPNAIKLP